MGKYASRDSTGTPVAWGDITGKPSAFDPNPHDNTAHSPAYAPIANPTFTGKVTASGDLDTGNSTDGVNVMLSGKNTVSYSYNISTKAGNYLSIVSNKGGAIPLKLDEDGKLTIAKAELIGTSPLLQFTDTTVGVTERDWRIGISQIAEGDFFLAQEDGNDSGTFDYTTFYISPDKKFGFGTSSPSEKVHIVGNGIITGSLMVYSS